LGVVFSAAFLCIDHISEIAATDTSLSIEEREASDALTGLKKLAGLTGEAVINRLPLVHGADFEGRQKADFVYSSCVSSG